MREILNYLGFSDVYNTEILEEILEEMCFNDAGLVDRLYERVDEVTYLKQCRDFAKEDCLLGEIDYGDGNHGSLEVLQERLRCVLRD